MKVTTYTYNSETQDYDPNVYELTYTVEMDGTGGSGADVILQQPKESTVAIPYAGKTASVTFPYRVLDEDGKFLLDADNAVWTITGDDTTGLGIERGVLTVEPTAKAGTYTVTLTVGEKSASQSITLTREASRATGISICRGGMVLTEGDVLRAPTSGTRSYPYTATVIDQYGVAFETAVTWSLVGEATGVSMTNGVVTLGSTAAKSFTLRAAAGDVSAELTVTPLAEQNLSVEKAESTDTGAAVTLKNSGTEEITVRGMIAAYDSNGRMLALRMADIVLAANGSGVLRIDYTADTVAYVRVFVLNAGTLEPLTQVWKSNG